MILFAVTSFLLTAFFSIYESVPAYADVYDPGFWKITEPRIIRFLRNLSKPASGFFSALLMGKTLSLVGLVVSSTLILQPFIRSGRTPYGLALLALVLGFSTIFAFIAGLLPLFAAQRLSLGLVKTLSFLFLPAYYLLKPFARLMDRFVPGRKMFLHGILPDGQDKFRTVWEQKEEQRPLPGQGIEVRKEIILYRNALDFSKVKLREIMVPRNEISVLDINSDVATLRKRFVETGFSRILFYEGNKDNIVGYVHTSAIFKNATSIKPFLKSVLIVPETMAANRLLTMFIREHRSIALVVDEFGGTSGLVTTEDILEEIFGEIEDEHDMSYIIEKQLNDRQFIFSGRIEIDVLNEKYHLNLQESVHYETLAGFILFHHESIPVAQTVVRAGNVNLKILKATKTKIELVQLTLTDS